MTRLYKIRLSLEWDEEYQTYTVTSPDVPQLVTVGSTPGEIYKNVQEAIDCLKEGAQELGIELPPVLQSPQSSPIIDVPALVTA